MKSLIILLSTLIQLPYTTLSFSASEAELLRANHPKHFTRNFKSTGEYNDQIFHLNDGHTLGYDELYIDNLANNDLVVYLCNLAETRNNQKSSLVKNFCKQTKKRFLAADWFGRGDSSGKLMEATLTRWKTDTIEFLDEKAKNFKGGTVGDLNDKGHLAKAVFVASGVGAWVALLIAMERPDLVRGIVGLSADPDFTEDLLWHTLDNEVKQEIMTKGFKEIKWGGRNEVYPITSSLIEDGRNNLVLKDGPKSLPILCPVKLIHSLDDEEVPLTVPMKLAECLGGDDVEVILTKIGGHALRDRHVLPMWIDSELDYAATQTVIQTDVLKAVQSCFDRTIGPDDGYIIG